MLVCGGGPAALAPIRALLEAGAEVTVVGPEISTTVADLAARHRLSAQARPLQPDDLDGVALVVPAGGDPAADEQARQLARARGVLATQPAYAGPPGPAQPEKRTGEVILVGGGPGDLALLTLGGLEAVRRADVIVTDRLAPLAALDQARPDAVIVDVAKIPRGAFTSQQRINSVLVEHAAGRTHRGPAEGRRQLRASAAAARSGRPVPPPASRSPCCPVSPPPSPRPRWPGSR